MTHIQKHNTHLTPIRGGDMILGVGGTTKSERVLMLVVVVVGG